MFLQGEDGYHFELKQVYPTSGLRALFSPRNYRVDDINQDILNYRNQIKVKHINRLTPYVKPMMQYTSPG